MRILHYSPVQDSMINQYVDMLCNGMGLECNNEMVKEAAEALHRLRSIHYDILHLHGCWHNSFYQVVRTALKENTRLVYSPHGQLEPWVIGDNYWKEKLPKRLLYQQRIVSQSYAVIVQGKMEEECMAKLGWNKRVVTVKNPLITHAITPQETARQIFKLYRKVMDSNQWQLMDENMRDWMLKMIKTGITGDERWLTSEKPSSPDTLEKWRMLLCYTHQEKIEETVNKAIRIFQFSVPDIDVEQIDYFLPDDYETPQTIESVIGISFASENERLQATFRHLRKLVARRQLTIMHLIELDQELRFHPCEEAALCETLKEQRLYKLASRLMQLMKQMTGLTEGFMLMPPLDDRTTHQIRNQINNHLNI